MGTSLSVLEQQQQVITLVIQIGEVREKFQLRSKIPHASIA
jgi:hypothetical protein